MAGKAFDLRTRMNKSEDPRAALFGNRYTPVTGSQDASMLEEQNDQHIAGLEDKVRTLREISLGISGAVRESNSVLGGMGDTMDKAGRLVKGTLGQVQNLMDRNVSLFKVVLTIVLGGTTYVVTDSIHNQYILCNMAAIQ